MAQKLDNLTYHGAGVLASRIERHWRDRGYQSIRVERFELPGIADTYGVRSNIQGDGYPPRGRAA